MGLWLYGRAKKIDDRTARAGLCVICAEYDASHSCIDERPGAHRAGLQCDVERALPKPPAAQCLARFSNGFQLCMGKGVFARFPAVTPPADDAARTGDNSATATSPSSRGKAGEKALLPASQS